MKQIASIFLILCVAFLLVACAGNQPSPTPQSTQEPAPEQIWEATPEPMPRPILSYDGATGELGETIVAAGTFWEDWWFLRGMFSRFEHIAWDERDEMPEHLSYHIFARLLPTSGFESISDIRNYLLQYHTEAWTDLKLFGEFPPFVEYDSILYINTLLAREYLIRPDWETATHTLIEQDGNHAVVETTVLAASWSSEFQEAQHLFTFIDGRIDHGPWGWFAE